MKHRLVKNVYTLARGTQKHTLSNLSLYIQADNANKKY